MKRTTKDRRGVKRTAVPAAPRTTGAANDTAKPDDVAKPDRGLGAVLHALDDARREVAEPRSPVGATTAERDRYFARLVARDEVLDGLRGVERLLQRYVELTSDPIGVRADDVLEMVATAWELDDDAMLFAMHGGARRHLAKRFGWRAPANDAKADRMTRLLFHAERVAAADTRRRAAQRERKPTAWFEGELERLVAQLCTATARLWPDLCPPTADDRPADFQGRRGPRATAAALLATLVAARSDHAGDAMGVLVRMWRLVGLGAAEIESMRSGAEKRLRVGDRLAKRRAPKGP